MRHLFESRQSFVSVLLGALLGFAFLYQFVPFVPPIVLAVIFAFALEPKVEKYRFIRSKALRTFLLLAIFFFAVVGPVSFAFYRIVAHVSALAQGGLENTQLYQSLDHLKDRILASLSEMNPDLVSGITGDTNYIGRISNWVLSTSTIIVSAVPDLVVAIFVFMGALYLLITQGEWIKQQVLNLRLMHPHKLNQVIKTAQHISYNTLITSVMIGGIQAFTIALGAFIFGYHEALLIFIITFFVSFIPVIGAGPVAFVLAMNSFLIGNTGSGIGLVVVSILGGSVDNLLKPYLVSSSDEENIHPVLSILAFVGAVLIYGFPGLLLGPILTQLAVALVPLLLRHEPIPPEPDSLK